MVAGLPAGRREDRAAGGLSGPAAKDYLQEEPFSDAGVTVAYMDYSGYPEYHQLYPPFEHRVSILDLIFNEGPDAGRYLSSFAQRRIDVPVEGAR